MTCSPAIRGTLAEVDDASRAGTLPRWYENVTRPFSSLHRELAVLLDPAFLHLEEVGEVGAEQDLDRAERGLLAEVARSRCLRACRARRSGGANTTRCESARPARRRPAQHEHAAERIRRGRRERLGLVAVQPQPQLREEARVAEEQALRAVGIDLARLRDEMQNAEPSTRVTMPSVPPRLALALVVHGSGIGEHASPFAAEASALAGTLAAMRIAVIAPGWFPVPPTGYGGIELVVALLADGLVDAGHDVTLFAHRRLDAPRPSS